MLGGGGGFKEDLRFSNGCLLHPHFAFLHVLHLSLSKFCFGQSHFTYCTHPVQYHNEIEDNLPRHHVLLLVRVLVIILETFCVVSTKW